MLLHLRSTVDDGAKHILNSMVSGVMPSGNATPAGMVARISTVFRLSHVAGCSEHVPSSEARQPPSSPVVEIV